jgi:hypothetical protein
VTEELILLRESIPRLDIVFEDANPIKYSARRFTGFNPVDASDIGGNNRFWYYQNEIDVSGWGVQGLTFYPTGFNVTQGPQMNLLEGGFVYVYDVLSQNPFDVQAWVVANLDTISNETPGIAPKMPSNAVGGGPEISAYTLGFEDILGGQTTLYAHSAGIMPQANGLPVNTTSYSSLEPTASDRLYVTRLVIVDNLAFQPSGLIKVPTARFILSGIATAEPMLSHIMRLKNSFKLAQTDVGFV